MANESDSSSVPECFNQMIVEEVGRKPCCKIRLEAVWKDSKEIEEKIFLVTSQDEKTGNKPLTIAERSKIRVHYIPALREPQKQMKQTAGTILYQLLKNVDWSEALTEKLKGVAVFFWGKRVKYMFSPIISMVLLIPYFKWS
ncbi:MAG: hypothetical protein ACRCTS_07125 [Fusobacteriaceae bacterium]